MPPSLQPVLITGFGPFSTYEENPSWLAAQKLHDSVITGRDGKPFAKITAIQLPVVYKDVLDIVPGLHASPPILPEEFADRGSSKPYALIVHIGVGFPGPLRVETIGHKLGYDKPDFKGKLADQDPISRERGLIGERYSQFEDDLHVKVDVQAIVDALGAQDGAVVKSQNAGYYVCDFTLYCSLAEAERVGKGTPSMFIHCCPLDQPMSTDQVADGVRKIITEVCYRL